MEEGSGKDAKLITQKGDMHHYLNIWEPLRLT